MATNMPLTLSDLQARINTLVSNDNDTPTDGDDEWNTRLNLIYQAIGKWELADVDWQELWTSYTHASTVANGDSDYTLTTLTDLRRPGGYVKLSLNGSNTLIEVIKPSESQLYSNTRVCWFTGNNDAGWTLNLGWTPTTGDNTVGATISFPYYKYAEKPATGTDKVEMSDPNYIVYDVAATKALMESKNNLYSVYNTEALTCMDRMKAMNELSPQYNNNRVEDYDAIWGASVIGE